VLLFHNHIGRRLRYWGNAGYTGFAIMVLPDNLPILRCPACGDIMKLVRSVQRLGGLPDLSVVACLSCNETEVKDVTRAA